MVASLDGKRLIRDEAGKRRLSELELWEVSLVTFPMLPEARVGANAATGFFAGAFLAATFFLATAFFLPFPLLLIVLT
mgnify:CR=1 FL=1